MAFVLVLLFAFAALGHFGLMLASHNWWYGLNLPRFAGKFIHLFHALLMVAGPVLFWYYFGLGLFAPFTDHSPWNDVLAVYLACCWLLGFAVIPWITWRRWRRRDPAVVRSSTGKVVDIAKELGGMPIGEGKTPWEARLPGNEIFQVEFSAKTLALPRLPAAWDGLTILHLSDLHLCGLPYKTFYRRVMEIACEREPDLVCMTGDVVDSIFHQRWILPTLGWLKWKIAAFAILGNHDYYYDVPFVCRALTRLKMHYLGNSWRQLEVRGEPMVVIGNESPWLRPHPDLTACPSGPFRLCLSHTPDNMRWAKRAAIDLVLAGHVHGGQIRFPVIGSLLVPSRYGRRYDCGTFHEGPTVMHVSRGLGGEHALRWGCRPEITLLTLQRG